PARPPAGAAGIRHRRTGVHRPTPAAAPRAPAATSAVGYRPSASSPRATGIEVKPNRAVRITPFLGVRERHDARAWIVMREAMGSWRVPDSLRVTGNRHD